MKNRSVTLVELLFVVIIVMVLAGIGVPNFLHAQVRSKVARTQSDMAVTEAAMRAYFADYNAWPPHNAALMNELLRPMAENPQLRIGDVEVYRSDEGTSFRRNVENSNESTTSTAAEEFLFAGSGFVGQAQYWRFINGVEELTPFGRAAYSGFDLTPLTTPVAYFSSILAEDLFSNVRGMPYVYLNYCNVYPPSGKANDLELHYLILSGGPDTVYAPIGHNLNMVHYVPGSYDPTNGTVSSGDIFHLER